jgi:muramoyltetrapeptide carboxypeptidase
MAGLLAGLALPQMAQPRTPSHAGLHPPRLRQGDTVGLIAPASSDDQPAHLDNAQATVRGMGLVPRTGPHASAIWGYFSGTDAQRAEDLHAMFADDSVRAIFAIRGGWGSARLLPLLDWDLIRAHPKLVIGSSDVTALHLAIAARAGFPTIHGPNVSNHWEAISWDSFWQMAFDAETPLLDGAQGQDRTQERWRITTLHPGTARGRLLGGNLSVLTSLVGTPWLPDFTGAILFIEEVGEAPYRVDRMLSQLALAGVLGGLAGVVFGQCMRCTANVPDYAGFTVPDLLGQYLTPLGIPAFAGANIGHIANQLSLPVGAMVEMDAQAGTLRLLQPIVA